MSDETRDQHRQDDATAHRDGEAQHDTTKKPAEPVDDVVATLAQAYRVEPGAIDGDVRAALERLVSEGFIVPAAP